MKLNVTPAEAEETTGAHLPLYLSDAGEIRSLAWFGDDGPDLDDGLPPPQTIGTPTLPKPGEPQFVRDEQGWPRINTGEKLWRRLRLEPAVEAAIHRLLLFAPEGDDYAPFEYPE